MLSLADMVLAWAGAAPRPTVMPSAIARLTTAAAIRAADRLRLTMVLLPLVDNADP
ncbi:hypothetical protein GCM10007977_110650 [Dactylosporangium sucinum]|uniref:Uncharacterized protein n=1 Tax=Dactylosporangium sucinum TaxID=1424081 RepID=A0A917UGF9_9ACTN|nr:hypothetical protein GCM10007977_110650 [Dactylosporangium sucinum]